MAKAPPDGTVLGSVPAGPLVINRHIYRTMPFDPLADFTPVSRFAAIPVVILAANDFPPRNIAEFSEWLRAGRAAACGTPGAGTTQHLTDMQLLRALGAECIIVHYRGTGPALPDLLTGKIQVYTDTVVTGLPPVREGRARALAIASRQRSSLAPEIPTVAETIPGRGRYLAGADGAEGAAGGAGGTAGASRGLDGPRSRRGGTPARAGCGGRRLHPGGARRPHSGAGCEMGACGAGSGRHGRLKRRLRPCDAQGRGHHPPYQGLPWHVAIAIIP